METANRCLHKLEVPVLGASPSFHVPCAAVHVARKLYRPTVRTLQFSTARGLKIQGTNPFASTMILVLFLNESQCKFSPLPYSCLPPYSSIRNLLPRARRHVGAKRAYISLTHKHKLEDTSPGGLEDDDEGEVDGDGGDWRRGEDALGWSNFSSGKHDPNGVFGTAAAAAAAAASSGHVLSESSPARWRRCCADTCLFRSAPEGFLRWRLLSSADGRRSASLFNKDDALAFLNVKSQTGI